MKRFLVLGLICLFLISCASMPTWLSKSAQREKARKDYFDTLPTITPQVREAILNGDVLMGMTQKQVYVSRWKPYEINRSTGSYGVHEQWVMVISSPGTYGLSGLDKKAKTYAYIYFENGKVTSWQSR